MNATKSPASPRARTTDPSNGTKGQKRLDPLTRYAVAENGCWIWQGHVAENGYGMCWTGGAHRHFYRKLVGEIPRGMHIDHVCHDPQECAGGNTCRHRRCVNPDHLRPVTPRDNVLRSNSFAAHHAAATHCPEGHPYSGRNLIVTATQRTCRICSTGRSRAAHARTRQAAIEAGSERPIHIAVLSALPGTDQEVASRVGASRQYVAQTRAQLARAGRVRVIGTRSVSGRRPALVWEEVA